MARRGAGLFLGGVWLGYEKRTYSLPTVLAPLGLSHVGAGRGPPPPPVRFFPRTLTFDGKSRSERERLTNDLPMFNIHESEEFIKKKYLMKNTIKRKKRSYSAGCVRMSWQAWKEQIKRRLCK